MTTSDRVSAEIIQFPARGRFSAASQDRTMAAQYSQRVARVAFGSGWYHDEAIDEAERAGDK
jgi:hypothetical protein